MISKLNQMLLIISIFLAMILVTIIWFVRPPEQVLGAIIILMGVFGLGLVIFKKYYEENTAKYRFRLDGNAIILIVINVAILLTIILLLIDTSGELLIIVMGYSLLALGGLAIVLVVAGVIFGLFFILHLPIMLIWSRGNIEDPYLFNEMQFALGGILRPLGFTLETQVHQGNQYAEFTKDEFHVSLSWENKVCWLHVYDKSAILDDKKRSKADFTVACHNFRKAEKFRSKSIAKLNEWLVKKKLK